MTVDGIDGQVDELHVMAPFYDRDAVVRKVSAAGVITRVAGTGTAGNTGDDGPATAAPLAAPTGVAVTADGGFLIADTFNHEVRKVAID